MRKPKINLIAPHYFYWVHLLICIIFGIFIFVYLKAPIEIKITPIVFFIILLLATNYYSIFRPIMADNNIELSGTLMFEILFYLYLYVNKYYFLFFIFGIINGQLFVHFYKREYQKIYLNATFFLANSSFYFIGFYIIKVDLNESFVILILKGVLLTLVYVGSEQILSGGFYARERTQPYFFSAYVGTKLYVMGYLNTILVFPIYLTLYEYTPWLIIATIFFSILGNELLNSSLAIKDAQEASLNLLTKTLEAKDPYTAGHSVRVQKYAIFSASKIHLTPWRISRLQDAALLHDIGKLVVPNNILNKPGKLTDSEYRKMKEHEEVTSKLIRMITFLRPVALFTEPEELYPFEENPKELIEPQIIYVCDAYDAMTSSRSYRRALTQETAIKELYDNAGAPDENKQFNIKAVDALIKYLNKSKEKHGFGYEEENFHESAPVVGTGSAGLGDLQKELREEVEKELELQEKNEHEAENKNV